jgi:hypothetical protein
MNAADTDQLFPNTLSTPGIEINPQLIQVRQVKASVIQTLQPQMSKAIWRPAPGRKLGFLIEHEQHLLGIAFLSSPVINMKERDNKLNLPKDPSDKGKELRHYADLSVCVPAQPFGWHWNGGKLVALIATTLGDAWQERYSDELKGIITTSLWGKGSQYNRIYQFLGYTQGFGHEHISDERYKQMLTWLETNGFDIPSSRFGAGSNPRMRRIQAYKKASGDKTITLKHGNKRGIYYHPATPSNQRQQIIQFWYERWGINRYERTRNQTPPYVDGLTTKDPAQ